MRNPVIISSKVLATVVSVGVQARQSLYSGWFALGGYHRLVVYLSLVLLQGLYTGAGQVRRILSRDARSVHATAWWDLLECNWLVLGWQLLLLLQRWRILSNNFLLVRACHKAGQLRGLQVRKPLETSNLVLHGTELRRR